jgi:8-oxo-dGDP phosphatase
VSQGFERIGSRTVWEGRIATVRIDRFRHADGEEAEREIVAHPGAVGVVAHDDERVWLVRQPREAVGDPALLEIPAGKLDVEGEAPLATAQRELAEEAGLAAERWSLLATTYSTPGFCDEKVQIYLAEGLADAERPEGFTAEHEELDLTLERVPLADAVQRVFDGGIRNSAAVVGVLAAAQAREVKPRLRPVDAD